MIMKCPSTQRRNDNAQEKKTDTGKNSRRNLPKKKRADQLSEKAPVKTNS
jgi:hypothetical protein